jgi:hypothetical protein
MEHIILLGLNSYKNYNDKLSELAAPFIKVKDPLTKRGSNKIKPKKKRN